MLFLALAADSVCPSLPTFLSCLSVCLSVILLYQSKRLGVSCCRRTSFEGQTTHTHTRTRWSEQRKQSGAGRPVPAAVPMTDCVSVRAQQTLLSARRRTVTQKDNSSVCARGDYSIPLLFLPHSHANPGLLTLQRHEITHTQKKHTQCGYTQGAWESVWPLQGEEGGGRAAGLSQQSDIKTTIGRKFGVCNQFSCDVLFHYVSDEYSQELYGSLNNWCIYFSINRIHNWGQCTGAQVEHVSVI